MARFAGQPLYLLGRNPSTIFKRNRVRPGASLGAWKKKNSLLLAAYRTQFPGRQSLVLIELPRTKYEKRFNNHYVT
jgi:hypothetical protein